MISAAEALKLLPVKGVKSVETILTEIESLVITHAKRGYTEAAYFSAGSQTLRVAQELEQLGYLVRVGEGIITYSWEAQE